MRFVEEHCRPLDDLVPESDTLHNNFYDLIRGCLEYTPEKCVLLPSAFSRAVLFRLLACMPSAMSACLPVWCCSAVFDGFTCKSSAKRLCLCCLLLWCFCTCRRFMCLCGVGADALVVCVFQFLKHDDIKRAGSSLSGLS